MIEPNSPLVIVDDDKITHLLLRKKIQLVEFNSEIKFFSKPGDALDYLKTAQKSKVVSDLNLEEMEAWDFLDFLEKQGFEGQFFLMTSSVNSSDRIRANSDSRISGFFEKPLSETDLLQILEA